MTNQGATRAGPAAAPGSRANAGSVHFPDDLMILAGESHPRHTARKPQRSRRAVANENDRAPFVAAAHGARSGYSVYLFAHKRATRSKSRAGALAPHRLPLTACPSLAGIQLSLDEIEGVARPCAPRVG